MPGKPHGQDCWWTAVHGVAESSTQLIMLAYEAEKTTEDRDNMLRAARKLMAGKACLFGAQRDLEARIERAETKCP